MEISDNPETANDTETTSGSSSPTTPGTQRYSELKALVAAMESDFQKFYNDGNKAAGTRVRGAMQELKNFAQAVRTEVQAIKNEKSAAS